jgi:drug/metabolite transporter (DMT)-like permease
MLKLHTSRIRGILCTLFGGICWGFSGACGQFLFTNYGLDTRWLTAIRMLSAGAILFILGLLQNRGVMKEILHKKRDCLQLILFGLLGLVTSQYTYLNAISYSNAGTATVLQYTGPVLILIYLCIRNSTWPKKREVLAILFALLGTFILATHGNFHQLVLSKQALVWGILSAVGLAFYSLLPVGLIGRYGSVPVTGYGMLIGGITLSVVMQIWKIPVTLDLAAIAAVGAMCVIGTVVAYTFYLQGVGEIGAAKAGMLASIEPVSATVISVVWLKSPFTGMDAVGFLLVLATVFLLAQKQDTESM